MIPIEFSMAVALCVGMTTLGILSFWFLSTRKQAMSFSRSQQQEIWQCPVCIYLYDDEMNKKLSLCPRCGSYNKKDEGRGTISRHYKRSSA